MINEYIPASALAETIEGGVVATKAPAPGQHAPVGYIVEYGEGVRLVIGAGTSLAQLHAVGEQLCALGHVGAQQEAKPEAKSRAKSQD